MIRVHVHWMILKTKQYISPSVSAGCHLSRLQMGSYQLLNIINHAKLVSDFSIIIKLNKKCLSQTSWKVIRNTDTGASRSTVSNKGSSHSYLLQVINFLQQWRKTCSNKQSEFFGKWFCAIKFLLWKLRMLKTWKRHKESVFRNSPIWKADEAAAEAVSQDQAISLQVCQHLTAVLLNATPFCSWGIVSGLSDHKNLS